MHESHVVPSYQTQILCHLEAFQGCYRRKRSEQDFILLDTQSEPLSMDYVLTIRLMVDKHMQYLETFRHNLRLWRLLDSYC